MKQFSGHDIFLWLHPDYPLLLPASVSAIWQLKGQESVAAPMLISGLFTVAVISILMFGVALLRTRNQGYLAGLAIMSVPVLYLWGCSQQADVPLSAYMLAALVCFSLHEVTNQNGLLYLSGTFAGMAAWTKNEGGLFALVFCTVAFLGLWATSQTKSFRIRKLAYLAFGLFPWALLLILFKIFLAPETDLFQQPLPELWAKLFTPGRYPQILSSFCREFTWFGSPFLVLYGLLFGLRFPRSKLIPVLVIAATVFGMFTGYFLVYVISPVDPSKLLAGSQERLFLQTWPSLLLLFFSVVQTPEDIYRRFSARTNLSSTAPSAMADDP
ncbi:MAG: glycosyltransferase family 39 protein [Candidatus Obscuribacterales bacterium]|nr:glycosyltransferase family 39 protein [Candidatus Obscuribacterales bacterium]